MPGLIAAEGKMVSAQAEFDRVAQRGAADDLHVSTIAEAHLQEPPAQIAISTDSDNSPCTRPSSGPNASSSGWTSHTRLSPLSGTSVRCGLGKAIVATALVDDVFCISGTPRDVKPSC